MQFRVAKKAALVRRQERPRSSKSEEEVRQRTADTVEARFNVKKRPTKYLQNGNASQFPSRKNNAPQRFNE